MRWTPIPRRVRSTRRPDSGRRHRDSGASLIEVLIAIVLLGTGVAAMLTALSVTIQATATERDHANAHAWLQTASDTLYRHERMDCTENTLAEIEAAYQAVLDGSEDPEGWYASGGQIEVVSPVLFWDGTIYQNVCYDDVNINLQLIQIQVSNPAGKIVESVQVVKG
jgi:Tfp pilus assembly protein PilV